MNPDPHPLLPWLTPERRSWLYRVVTAALPLLALYGIAAEQDLAVWASLAAAFLSTGTAALHTPTRIVQEPADEGVTVLEAAAISFVVCLVLLIIFDVIA